MATNRTFDLRANPQGYLIPHENGAALSCAIDPEKQARQWMDKNKHYIQLGLPVTVLGIGAGLHLQKLHQLTLLPITAVDTRPGLISWARKIFKQTEINFVLLEEKQSVLTHPLLTGEIGRTLPLIFEPAAGNSLEHFRTSAENLRGRSDEVWTMKNLDPAKPRHWREWAVTYHDVLHIEQKILKEVLS
ncbi:MAG: hypothetical protein V4736_09590 [Bdellovibrionota bacterium]